MEQYKITAVVCRNFIDFTDWAFDRGIRPYNSDFIDKEGEKYIPVFKVDQIMGRYFNEVEVTNPILKGSYLHEKSLQRVR